MKQPSKRPQPRSTREPPTRKLSSPRPHGLPLNPIPPLFSRVSASGVLGDALPDPETLLVELVLKLSPQLPVLPRLGEALPEQPDRRVVQRLLGEAEEPLEAKAVVHLPLQLRVAEAVPALEHQ